MCAASGAAGVFLQRTRDASLNRELLTLFRASRIPVVLLGGAPPPAGLPCDLVGMNYISASGRRRGVDLSSPAARRDASLLRHGELLGDVAVRLMLQRLSYSPRHPPAEVYLDLPCPLQDKKHRSQKKGTRK